MILTVIGCSGSAAGANNPPSCYLLEAADSGRTWRVVLDLGAGALPTLLAHTHVTELDAVFLTHGHPDHCADIEGLSVSLRYGYPDPARDRLPVYGPAGIGEFYAADTLEPFDLREIAPSAGAPVHISVGPFEVVAAPVWHSLPGLALRVEAPRLDGTAATLTYTGDTDLTQPPQDDAVVALAAGTDLLLAEAGWGEQDAPDGWDGVHLNGTGVGVLAEHSQPGRVLVTHIPPWRDADTTRAQAAAVFSGPVDLARPGQRIAL